MTREQAATEAIKKYPDCKMVAVMNFVWTLVGTDRESEVKNVYLDAKVYGWNVTTVDAILYGIDLFYNSLN